jgi:hypothetical protein
MALNHRQTAFAREYAIDKNATQAAIRAGYSAKTAHSAGPRLLDNVEVRAEIERTLTKSAARVELTVAGITSRLLALADKANNLDGSGALNVSRQCLMDAAKLNGLVVDTHETIARSPEERSARLAALKAERERLASVH